MTKLPAKQCKLDETVARLGRASLDDTSMDSCKSTIGAQSGQWEFTSREDEKKDSFLIMC